jgi:hypothetical protein
MRFLAKGHGGPDSRCSRQCHRRASVNTRPASETSAETLSYTICMCSRPLLSKRRFFFCVRKYSELHSLRDLGDENARHSILCECR